jgi:hypothetical protein
LAGIRAGTTRAAPASLSAPMKNKSRQSLSLALFPKDRHLHDIYIHAADGLERPRFVLAILELAFLMRRKRRAESRCDRFSRLRSCAQRKKP